MASPAVRSIAAVVVGVLMAVLVIAVVEMAGHLVFPPPPGLDVTDPADQAKLMDEIPLPAMIAVVVAWFLGSLAGASTAIAIAHRILPAWSVALVIAAMGLWTTQMFPHPGWMIVSAMVLPLVAVLVAKRVMAEKLTG